MRRARRLGPAAVLRLLLVAHVAAAFDPVSVGLVIGAASALTGYLSYTDLYCRFAECCREEQPLNASGTRVGREGGRVGPRSGLQPWNPCLLRQTLQIVGFCPASFLNVRIPWDYS